MAEQLAIRKKNPHAIIEKRSNDQAKQWTVITIKETFFSKVFIVLFLYWTFQKTIKMVSSKQEK